VHTADHQLLLFPPVRPLVDRFGAEFFRSVPQAPGVYLMCGESEGVLYVGKARNLRRRLASYRSAGTDRLSRKHRRLMAAVRRIHWDLCPDEDTAIVRERELLLALRPRFNTVGTWPAPEVHLGWRWTGGILTVGCGDSAEGWDQSIGPLRRLRPVYRAMLRLTWRAIHPEALLHEIPLALSNSRPPACWNFEPDACSRDSLIELIDRLAAFLRGDSVDLVEWLLMTSPNISRFEQQWREQDAECLLEYFERVSRKVSGPTNDESGSRNPVGGGGARHIVSSAWEQWISFRVRGAQGTARPTEDSVQVPDADA
jgi:predicted GIY-YIG superfamily endonuclease